MPSPCCYGQFTLPDSSGITTGLQARGGAAAGGSSMLAARGTGDAHGNYRSGQDYGVTDVPVPMALSAADCALPGLLDDLPLRPPGRSRSSLGATSAAATGSTE